MTSEAGTFVSSFLLILRGYPLKLNYHDKTELLLLLLNTGRLQQVENYIRGVSMSTKYWPPSTCWSLCQRLYYFYQTLTLFQKLKLMSECVLLLPNTDYLQQIEDYIRGCTISTKYWQPENIWRLCQRLYRFYLILTAFNKLRIISEVYLCLPNTDRLQQVEDYIRGVSMSTKYWPPQQVEDYVRVCSTSTKYWPPSKSWRFCQRLYHFYLIQTTFNKLKIISEVVLLLPNTAPPSKRWRLYMSEVVLLLPKTTRLPKVEDFVRGCTTST